MAILISNLKARSKGAMTNKPFANLTFTESLFILEDTMGITRSRQIEREKYQKHYGIKLPRSIVVHHLDGNPFNNNINNLGILSNREHTSYHWSISPLSRRTRNKRIMLKQLQSLLVIFNDR